MAGTRQGQHVVIGPAQRGADGRFLNPDGSRAGQGLRALWRLWREGFGTPWPAPLEDPREAPPPRDIPAGYAAFTFIGHSTFLVRLDDGRVLLFDPVFSERCSPVAWAGPRRVRPPALSLAALDRVDVVLVSHAHYDHMDLPSLRELHARFAPRFVAGLGNAAFLARHGIPDVTELDWGRRATLPGGHVVVFLPMRHFAARTWRDRSRTLWGGFAIEAAGGGRFMHCGDTAWGEHLAAIGQEFGPFDAAMIPIGAYDPEWFMQAVHITPEQAVAAQRDLRARTAIAMHFGTFKLTREPIGEPVDRLRAAVGDQDFRIPRFGETILLPLQNP
ncbi:MBL fold metallo-hydrolase [Sabulicella rubraurantiaca]|uniref:MBL fold metallo-hydrolase n=1 Tax=Sabulicella rubraurantiaca TaxID=2811429 RepID=UPI001A969FA8|nr:MBL fold metallo-hydrolase [Sabulicella rubraurantiaca]